LSAAELNELNLIFDIVASHYLSGCPISGLHLAEGNFRIIHCRLPISRFWHIFNDSVDVADPTIPFAQHFPTYAAEGIAVTSG
jgi:hypothetical protein